MGKLSIYDFERIANEETSSILSLESYSVGNYRIGLTYKSNSGKSPWNASVEFDEDTGYFTSCVCPHPNSYAPHSLGKQIESRLIDFINSQQD